MTISPEKEKAVETAMQQIERQFGKGSIMNSEPKRFWIFPLSIPVLSRLIRRWALAAFPGEGLRKFLGLNHPAKPRLRFMLPQKRKNRAE